MSAETLVRDDITRCGQHWIEVLRMGQPVDVNNWIERVPLAVRHLMKSWQRHETALDVYRLYMHWPVRELVRVKIGDVDKEVVVWCIEPGQTIRGASLNAAAELWMERGRWPEHLWLWKVPEGAPKMVELPEGSMEVMEAQWAPTGYVVVG